MSAKVSISLFSLKALVISIKGHNKKDLGTNYASLNSLWETSVLSLRFHEYHIGGKHSSKGT